MNGRILSHIDSTVWFIRQRNLDELRMSAVTNSKQLDSYLSFAQEHGKLPEGIERYKPQSLAKTDNPDLANTFYTQNQNGVAVVNISDALYFSGGYIDDILAEVFGGTSTKKLMSDIAQIKLDPFIKSVVLNINSGGGEAFGINELADMIADLNKTKPVTAYISGLGCSAAYFLAANAGRIVADKQAWIGSIGVVSTWVDYSEFYKSMGIIYEEVTSDNAPYKRLDPKNEEHRQIFKDELNGVAKVFEDSVAKGRNVSVETVRTLFGQGAVMAGWEAKKAGMIDETGSLRQVIAKSAKSVTKQTVSAKSQTKPNADTKGDIANMNLLEKFQTWLASDDAKPLLEENEQVLLDAGTTKPNAEADALRFQLNTERAEKEKLLAEKTAAERASLSTKAKDFALSEMKAGRLTSAEDKEFQASYLQALTDDANSPLPTGTRAANIEAAQQKRPPHLFRIEALPAAAKILPGEEQDEENEMAASVNQQVKSYISVTTPKSQNKEKK